MTASHSLLEWTLVVPIRDPRGGKSRLCADTAVATAIARDTLSAALECPAVGRVLLITDRLSWAARSIPRNRKLRAVLQDSPGLTAAIANGVSHAGSGAVAVMLGDLPALDTATLGHALIMAAQVPLGMVTDHQGSGTTLITARQGNTHRPSFGPGSAARHRDNGYRELSVHHASGLRWDVDTQEDLREALLRGACPATRRAVELTEVLAS